MEGRRRRRDEAKSHGSVSETRLLRDKGRNEDFPWQNPCPWNMAAMREAVQPLCCAQWKLALPKERSPHHCSHLDHDVKSSSSSFMPLFQQPSLEMGNTGGHKKRK